MVFFFKGILVTFTKLVVCSVKRDQQCCSRGNWRTINCQRLPRIMQTNFNVARGADKRAEGPRGVIHMAGHPTERNGTHNNVHIIFHWAAADIIPELPGGGQMENRSCSTMALWIRRIGGWCARILAINADYSLMSEGSHLERLQPQCNLAALSGKKLAIRKSLGQVAVPFPGDNYNAISMFRPQSD